MSNARNGWRTGLFGALAAVALMGAGPARADGLELQAGQQELGVAVGKGFFLPFDVFEGRTDAPYVFVQPTWGRFLGPRNELVVGVPIMVFYDHDATAAGISFGLRHHFLHRGRWLPFFEFGAGGVVTNLNIPDIGGDFQFIPHGGFGLRYRADDRTSFILTGQWFHMSNAGLRSPNTGKDNALATVTYSRMF